MQQEIEECEHIYKCMSVKGGYTEVSCFKSSSS